MYIDFMLKVFFKILVLSKQDCRIDDCRIDKTIGTVDYYY